MAKPQNYGSKYWCITGDGDPLYLYADTLVVETGALVAYGGFRANDESPQPDGEMQEIYAIAAGQWHTFFAASLISGDPVCFADER